jgi:hypothetical protein
MIDTLYNILFRCHHRNITRPVTPVSKAGVPDKGTYVVCLDCGKQFHYDWKEMRMGRAVDISTTPHALRDERRPKSRKVGRYVLWASAVPAAWVVGNLFKSRPTRKNPPESPQKPEIGS